MKTMKSKSIAFLLAAMFIAGMTQAQGDKSKRPSPPAKAEGVAAGAHITIDYSTPGVKDRKIWGGLVPYDKFWRAGANEATLFTTDKDIKIEGKTLPEGTYSLFAKPGENEWTIVFNSQTGQWGINRDGTANFDPANNVVEVMVKPEKAPKFYERLAYEIDDNGFSLIWENLKVPVSIM